MRDVGYALPLVPRGSRWAGDQRGEPPGRGACPTRSGGLRGWPDGSPEPSSAALTVLAAGQAACALLALLSDRGADSPSAYVLDALNPFVQVGLLDAPRTDCRCRTLVGRADGAG